jgi:GT2 family glycosyltransferase
VSRAVRIVVVAYGAPADLQECLAELNTGNDVIVVDNSCSGDVRAVAEVYGAQYVDAGSNVGFAAGVNIALALLHGEHDVLLLNPDARISRSQVQQLWSYMHRPGKERVGAVAPVLVNGEDSPERVEWPFPSPARAWVEAVGLGRLPSSRTFMIGAVLLLRREALQDVGGFDERFFLYAEETDWQRRARDAGWESELCTDVSAEHAGAGTSDDPVRREILFHAGQETYIRKWYGSVGWFGYRLAACAGSAVRSVVLPRERRIAAARRTLLYVRGPRRRAHAVGALPQ